MFYSYPKCGDVNIRKAEHSRAVHVSFILKARGRSRAETNMDKLTRLRKYTVYVHFLSYLQVINK